MKAWLHSPFIDLSVPVSAGYLLPYGIELAARSFLERRDAPRFRSYPIGFRPALAAELGAVAFATDDPRALHAGHVEHRTARWQRLCDALADAGDLDLADFDRLCWLLHRLCFNRLAATLCGARAERARDPIGADIAYTAALAEHIVAFEEGGVLSADPFDRLLDAVPFASNARIQATYHRAQIEAKTSGRPEILSRLLDDHDREIAAFPDLTPFEAARHQARRWRLFAFLPQLQDRPLAMMDAMERAETLTGLVPASGEEQALCRRELMWPVHESWIKAHLAVSDLAAAERRARLLVEDTPLQARAHLHLATVLLERDDLDGARAAFGDVVRLGPGGTEIALSYLGQFAAEDGDHAAALELYARALAIDPGAASVLECLRDLPGIDEGYLAHVAARQAQMLATRAKGHRGFAPNPTEG